MIIDPKGENATVTARRRGGGSDYVHGLGQEVRILDPFGEVAIDRSRDAPGIIDCEIAFRVDHVKRVETCPQGSIAGETRCMMVHTSVRTEV